MSGLVIAISRQYGAAGREIAVKLAELLGVNLYDRQLVHIAAAELNLNMLTDAELEKLENEVPPLGMNFTPFFTFGMKGEKPLNQQIFEGEAKVIARLAKRESCVILGRCADFILRGQPNVLTVFVQASDDFRAERGKTVYGGKTIKELKAEDAKRAAYYKYFTASEFGDSRHFDLVVNADKGTTDDIAKGIADYARSVIKLD